MQRINVGWWYSLAQELAAAASVDMKDAKLEDAWYFLRADSLLYELEQSKVLEITTSRAACRELRAAVQGARDLSIKGFKGDESHEHQRDCSLAQIRITSALETLEKVLQEELKIADVYAVGQKRIYSTRMLIDRAEEALGETARATISEQAKKDLREAGRSLAFEIPTAAGFHAMRAVEKTVRDWYEIRTGDKAGRSRWGDLINKLRKSEADEVTLAALDRVRDLHRNPLSHPDLFLSLDEALEVFGAAETAINAVSRQLLLAKKAEAS